MTTRAEFLHRIRTEMGRAPGLVPSATAPRPTRPRERLEVLRRELSERWRESLERFAVEFERVGGVLHRVGDAEEVPGVVARIAGERRARSVIAWPGATLGVDVTASLVERGLDALAMPEAEVTPAERARLRAVAAAADVGVTGVDLAVAETGTLIVVSGGNAAKISTRLIPSCRLPAPLMTTACSMKDGAVPAVNVMEGPLSSEVIFPLVIDQP